MAWTGKKRPSRSITRKSSRRWACTTTRPRRNTCNLVGQRVARVSDLPNEEFKFFVIDDAGINAFTTGCCNVYVNRGLLVSLNSEAELAGVLGHEIGHVTARHPARRQARGVAAQLGAMAAAILTGSTPLGQLANIGAQAWMQGYGRENEMEADRLGMKYMVKAGYNPESIGKVFNMFQAGEKFERQRARAEGREPRLYHGVFSSHPSPDQRAVQAAKGAANIKDAPPEGWLDPARRIPHDHQRHRLRHEQGAGHRARQPLLSCGHGHHGRVSARLDHRESARPAAGVHAEERRGHADHDRQEAGEAGAARVPADQAEGQSTFKGEPITTSEGNEGYTIVTRSGSPIDNGLGPVRWAVVYRGESVFIFAGASRSAMNGVPEVDGLIMSVATTLRGLRPAEFPLAEPYRIKVVKATDKTKLSDYAADMPEDKFKKETLELINAMYPNKKPQPGQLFKIVE